LRALSSETPELVHQLLKWAQLCMNHATSIKLMIPRQRVDRSEQSRTLNDKFSDVA